MLNINASDDIMRLSILYLPFQEHSDDDKAD